VDLSPCSLVRGAQPVGPRLRLISRLQQPGNFGVATADRIREQPTDVVHPRGGVDPVLERRLRQLDCTPKSVLCRLPRIRLGLIAVWHMEHIIVRRVHPAIGCKLQRLVLRLVRPARQPTLRLGRRPALQEKPSLQPEVRQAGMIVRTTTWRPEVLALGLADRQVVDARMAAPHEPVAVEFPVFVSVRAEPVTAVVVPLVREANGDAIAAHGPELFDETVVQLFAPLAPQELHDGLTAGDELGAIAPHALDGIEASCPRWNLEQQLSDPTCNASATPSGRENAMP